MANFNLRITCRFPFYNLKKKNYLMKCTVKLNVYSLLSSGNVKYIRT
jgi:hypothetical protein